MPEVGRKNTSQNKVWPYLYLFSCGSEFFPIFPNFMCINNFIVHVVKASCQMTFKDNFIFLCLVTFDSTGRELQ